MGRPARSTRRSLHSAHPILMCCAALCCGLVSNPAQSEEGSISALIFGSLDAGASPFITAGAKITFDGRDRDGFAILASGGAGARAERGPTIRGISTDQTRLTALGAVLAGYQWFRDWGVVAAFAGPEGSIEVERNVVGTLVLPDRYGIRLHGEVWGAADANQSSHRHCDPRLDAPERLGPARLGSWPMGDLSRPGGYLLSGWKRLLEVRDRCPRHRLPHRRREFPRLARLPDRNRWRGKPLCHPGRLAALVSFRAGRDAFPGRPGSGPRQS